jgi:hypothetical protein
VPFGADCRDGAPIGGRGLAAPLHRLIDIAEAREVGRTRPRSRGRRRRNGVGLAELLLVVQNPHFAVANLRSQRVVLGDRAQQCQRIVRALLPLEQDASSKVALLLVGSA